jgi:hypothetical protein
MCGSRWRVEIMRDVPEDSEVCDASAGNGGRISDRGTSILTNSGNYTGIQGIEIRTSEASPKQPKLFEQKLELICSSIPLGYESHDVGKRKPLPGAYTGSAFA